MNYGLDISRELQEHSPEDYVLGGTVDPDLVCDAQIPPDEREQYLPTGEVQRGVEDTSDCASRVYLNLIETKLNYLYRTGKLKDAEWFESHGYIVDGSFALSDAFIAILSGTTRNGNSLKAPIDTIHRVGVIPKSMLPLLPTMTFDEYHNRARITDEMIELGKQFLERIPVYYKRVELPDFDTILDTDMIAVGGYAWPRPVNGIYPATENMPNHAFLKFQKKKLQVINKIVKRIFDNYRDSFDGDFIKHLAENYGFLKYGYLVYLKQLPTQTSDEQEMEELITKILDKLVALLRALHDKIMKTR